jgi:hypothetical protein
MLFFLLGVRLPRDDDGPREEDGGSYEDGPPTEGPAEEGALGGYACPT